MEIVIKFYGIDNFNRPIFKQVNKQQFFGLIDHLFRDENEFNDKKDYFLQWLDTHQDNISFFGTHFNCEPLGIYNKNWKFKIIA